MTSKVRIHRGWVFTLIVASAALAYAVFVFLPLQRSIASVRIDTREYCRYARDTEERFLTFSNIEQSLQETQQYVEKWRNHAPQPGNFSAFLGEITKIAGDSHLALQRFTPLAVSDWETLREHPIEAVVEGSFSHVLDFLTRLETLSATVWVESLEMQAIGEDGAKLRCELILKVFDEKPESSD